MVVKNIINKENITDENILKSNNINENYFLASL